MSTHTLSEPPNLLSLAAAATKSSKQRGLALNDIQDETKTDADHAVAECCKDPSIHHIPWMVSCDWRHLTPKRITPSP